MQFLEDLTDRQAADAVRSRIDWKYLLSLDLGDPGFDFSVLSEFRSRVIAGKLEQRLLDRLLEQCKQKGWLQERGKQRTDSTHVLAAIRTLNRLESIGEALRAALNAIATVEPEWLKSWVPPAWFERYGRPVEAYRLPKGKEARQSYAERVGTDGMELLTRVWTRRSAVPTGNSNRRLPPPNLDASILGGSWQLALARCERFATSGKAV
jgi:transposase